MMGATEFFNNFSKAEYFYYDQFWSYLIAGLLLLFFWLIMMLYARKTEKKVVSVLVFAYVIPVCLWITFSFVHYQPMINLSSRLTASVRDYSRIPYSKVEYSLFEKNAYRNHYLPSNYEGLPMYIVQTLEEPVTYLGRDKNFGYVELEGETYKVDWHYFEVSDSATESVRQGIQYILNEEQFQSLGFLDHTRIFLTTIIVPKDQTDKNVSQDLADSIRSTKNVMRTWVLE